MSEFYGGDLPSSDPFEVVARWIDEARRHGEAEPTAVNLATVDGDGLPDIRVVYVREINQTGFVFYTNYESAKGHELAQGKAALNYYFPIWRRQIRVRGLVEKVSKEQSDAYFLQRPEQSRLGAWMSQQSRPVKTREQMQAELDSLDQKLAQKRPPYWGGFKVLPLQIEFWAMGDYRIHDRFLWSREELGQEWVVKRLYP